MRMVEKPCARNGSNPVRSILEELATPSAHRDFRPTDRLPEMHPLFCDPCALLRLFLICLFFAPLRLCVRFIVLDQRLINEVRKPLEEAVLVVWEMLGKDEHDKFFSRIDHA